MDGVREGKCRYGGWSVLSRRWSSFVLAVALVSAGWAGVEAQEQSSTTIQTQTSDWVMLERTRWTALTTLALTLETRLTERVTQAETLQNQLSQSRQSIETLTDRSQTLQTALQETKTSRDNWRTSLEQERILWSAERLELVSQRDRAREQRDIVTHRAAKLEMRNRRNGLIWKIGIPVGVLAGALVWEVIR